MACNYPITAYRVGTFVKGKMFYEVVFEERKGDVVERLHLPCGKCLGCMLERSRQWAIRCVHEAKMHERNCFITLTYNDEHLPAYESLDYTDFQKFMKRLRKHAKGHKIRFFMCGEYGDRRKRPHYHACIFGYDFMDRVLFKRTGSGSNIYTSEELQKIWSDNKENPIGFASVGDVTFDSAGYISRYVLKKSFGHMADHEYKEIDMETGEVISREKEFVHMSLKPGIGYPFYKKYFSDVFPNDLVVADGVAMKPPKYYTKKLREEDADTHELVLARRMDKGIEKGEETESRMLQKEKVLEASIKFLKREMEA